MYQDIKAELLLALAVLIIGLTMLSVGVFRDLLR